MNLGPAIYNRLTTFPALAALIGDRLYPKVVPEHVKPVFPLAVYMIEDQDREGTYEGGSGLTSTKVTVACAAKSPAGLAVLRDAVLEALDEQSGTWNGLVVQGCFFENEQETADRDPTTGEESLYFGSELEFLVWFEA